jgi:hypothetical protein
MSAMVAQPIECVLPGGSAGQGYDASATKCVRSTGVQPTKLFVGGISSNTSTKVLRDHFSEYGNVLDCVAMRKPDGRSRGFGLVTLDSLAAAEHCLAVPMVIDGRVVDMKAAVPEGRGNPMGRAAPSTQNRMGNIYQAPKWAASLSAPAQACTKAPVALSASAPEFVPFCVKAPVPKAQEARVHPDEDVLVFAEDYVAFLEDQERLCAKAAKLGKASKSASKIKNDSGTVKQAQMVPHCPPPPQAPPPPPAPVSDAQDRQAVIVEDVPSEDLLSTKGSALHSSGTCRPCNFFPKGRCDSGADCTFCHLSHEVRKPTRQEKRERQAAWQARQLAGEKSTEDDGSGLIAALLVEKPSQQKPQNRKTSGTADALPCPAPAGPPPGLAGGSPALLAALKGTELPPRSSQVIASPAVLDMPLSNQLPAAFALNFADYCDSDEDSDFETEHQVFSTSAVETVSSGHRWSREEMLRSRLVLGVTKAPLQPMSVQ